MARNDCLTRVVAGVGVGGAVGGAIGAVYGTYDAFRQRIPGILKCAVIELPSQTLLLASTDKPGRMIGMLFPGDMVVFKPNVTTSAQQPTGAVLPMAGTGQQATGEANFSQAQLQGQLNPQQLNPQQQLSVQQMNAQNLVRLSIYGVYSVQRILSTARGVCAFGQIDGLFRMKLPHCPQTLAAFLPQKKRVSLWSSVCY